MHPIIGWSGLPPASRGAKIIKICRSVLCGVVPINHVERELRGWISHSVRKQRCSECGGTNLRSRSQPHRPHTHCCFTPCACCRDRQRGFPPQRWHPPRMPWRLPALLPSSSLRPRSPQRSPLPAPSPTGTSTWHAAGKRERNCCCNNSTRRHGRKR